MSHSVSIGLLDALNVRIIRALGHFDHPLFTDEIAMIVGEPNRSAHVSLSKACADGHVRRIHRGGERVLFVVTADGRAYVAKIISDYQAIVDRDFAEFRREAA